MKVLVLYYDWCVFGGVVDFVYDFFVYVVMKILVIFLSYQSFFGFGFCIDQFVQVILVFFLGFYVFVCIIWNSLVEWGDEIYF